MYITLSFFLPNLGDSAKKSHPIFSISRCILPLNSRTSNTNFPEFSISFNSTIHTTLLYRTVHVGRSRSWRSHRPLNRRVHFHPHNHPTPCPNRRNSHRRQLRCHPAHPSPAPHLVRSARLPAGSTSLASALNLQDTPTLSFPRSY